MQQDEYENGSDAAGSRPRVLLLNMWQVYPPTSGGAQCVTGLAESLAKYADCTLATVDEKAREYHAKPLLPGLTLATLPCSDHRGALLNRLQTSGILLHSPALKRAMRYPHSTSLRHALRELIASHDAVVLCHPWLWPAVKRAVPRLSRPVFYDAHNVEHELVKISGGNWLARQIGARATRRLEVDLALHSSEVWCCTEQDAASFRSACNTAIRTRVGLKGRPKAKMPPRPLAGRSRSAIFAGSYWPPNNEAAQYICSALAPNLPDCMFYIAGGCGKAVTNPPPNVRLLGYVPDLDDEIGKHRVALHPICSGSGINIKVMDYMATGTPVVATAFGCRGFPASTTRWFRVSDLDAFHTHVKELLHDDAQWEQCATRLPAEFESHFSWDAIGAQAFSAITRHIETPPARTLPSPRAA